MRFIATDKINDLLAELAEGSDLWIPAMPENSESTVLFTPWQAGLSPALDRYTTLSAKEMVLPATEKLFDFKYVQDDGGERIEIDQALAPGSDTKDQTLSGQESGPGTDQEIAPATAKSILFGARACDAKAMAVLDPLFNGQPGQSYSDPHYRSRRRGLVIFTIACTSCDAACFCSSFGGGPADKTGSDVFLYPVGGGFLAEGITEAGCQMIAAGPFTESDEPLPPLANPQNIDIKGINEKLPDLFSDIDFWQQVSRSCLSCGYCTYCCPTCHCFNIFDEMRSDREGERLRSWDSCMFHLYTQEASGHNPRPTPAHRYRNRVNHKFNYYPDNHGLFLCTGCGRCIRGCPSGMDIRKVLKAAADHESFPATMEEAGG